MERRSLPQSRRQKLYAATRGSHTPRGAIKVTGSVAVIDSRHAASSSMAIPGGGSPDMATSVLTASIFGLSGRL